MNEMPATRQAPASPTGADIAPLDGLTANQYIAWLLGGGERPADLPEGEYYAVLQCADSLVWGVSPQRSPWAWASDAYRNRANPPVRAPLRVTLLEARVFHAEAEALLWRDGVFGEEAFRGRIVRDDATATVGPYRPLSRFYIFEGGEQPEAALKAHPVLGSRFVKRVAAGGNTTLAPRGAGLCTREYLQADPETGVARVALTRFVSIALSAPAPTGREE